MNKTILDEGNKLNNRIVELERAIEFLSNSKTTVTITIENSKIFDEHGFPLFYALPKDIEKIKDKLVLLLGQYQIEFKDLK